MMHRRCWGCSAPLRAALRAARVELLCGDAGADLAAHARAAEAAIAERVLGEILLMIVFGEVERRRIDDLGSDRTVSFGAQCLVVRRLGGVGGAPLRI